MLTTDQLRSPVFDRLTDRLAPKLTHPTAAAFDFDDWGRIILDDELGVRDVDLLKAAQYLAECLKGVRNLLSDALGKMSGEQMLELAMINANRIWNTMRWKLVQAMPSSEDGAQFITALGKLGVSMGPNGEKLNPDDANNALTDSLPYWFAEAAKADGSGIELDRDAMAEALRWGHVAANLMQVFKSVWQQVLWEPYGFDFDETMAETIPRRRGDLLRWKAWAWREQTLISQSPLLDRNLERGIVDLEPILPLTAVAVGPGGISVGSPDRISAATHRTELDTIRASYLAPFLSDRIGAEPGVTVELLVRAVCVLQDLVSLRLPRNIDPARLDEGDPSDLACAFDRGQIVDLLSSALAVDRETASACVEEMSVDPFGSLNSVFTLGLWHRPLVRSRDGATIMIAAGALVWGSPIRRVERWLQRKAGKNDLSKTSTGKRHEKALQGALTERIERNALLANVAKGVSFVPGKKADEEIDLLIRIGSTIIVGEIKCLLSPAEPIDRADYVRKLEDACAQASRKAGSLRIDPSPLIARFGADAGECRLVPLVIVNQSNGVEWEYDDCAITDARFLKLFCGGGSFVFGGKLHSDPGKDPELFERTIYEDATGAEAAIPGIFLRMPGMDPFRDSVAWGQSDIPLPYNHFLRLNVARDDVEAYIATMGQLLGDNNL